MMIVKLIILHCNMLYPCRPQCSPVNIVHVIAVPKNKGIIIIRRQRLPKIKELSPHKYAVIKLKCAVIKRIFCRLGVWVEFFSQERQLISKHESVVLKNIYPQCHSLSFVFHCITIKTAFLNNIAQ